MQQRFVRLPSLAWVAGVAGLAACASSPASRPAVPQQIPGPSQAGSLAQQAAPDDKCDKPVKITLQATGGTFTLPPCGGYTVTVKYGKEAASGAETATVEDGLDDFNGVPTPPPTGGTPIFFWSFTNEDSFTLKTPNHLTVSSAPSSVWSDTSHYIQLEYENGDLIDAARLGVPKCSGSVCVAHGKDFNLSGIPSEPFAFDIVQCPSKNRTCRLE